MNYLIDGYNLLFLFHIQGSLQEQRRFLVEKIQKIFAARSLCGIIVFDGARIEGEDSGLAYASPLEIVFTSQKTTADEWIVEKIERSKKRNHFIVISDDHSIQKHARHLGAQIQSRQAFLQFLFQKKFRKEKNQKEIRETPRSLERLLKIFTERFEKGIEDGD